MFYRGIGEVKKTRERFLRLVLFEYPFNTAKTNAILAGVFPNIDSYIRPATSCLIKYSEVRSGPKACIHPEKIALIQEEGQIAA